MVVVGLHRAGRVDNWDGEGAKGFNYGSSFSEILKSIKENWHPSGMYITMYVCTYCTYIYVHNVLQPITYIQHS